MKKLQKTSVVFFALVMLLVANFSIAMASSYDFTLVRAVGQNSGAVSKNKIAQYGYVEVLGSSAPSYTTDYAIIMENRETPLTDFVRVLNDRGERGKMFYNNPNYIDKVRLRGVDNTLKAPNYTHITGLWTPYEEMNH